MGLIRFRVRLSAMESEFPPCAGWGPRSSPRAEPPTETFLNGFVLTGGAGAGEEGVVAVGKPLRWAIMPNTPCVDFLARRLDRSRLRLGGLERDGFVANLIF